MNIPIDIRQITYKQYCEFKALDEAYRLNEDQELAGAHLIAAVNTIIKHDKDVPLYAEQEVPADFTYKFGSEISVQASYIHLINLINSYEPSPWNEVLISNSKYYLDAMTVEALLKPNAQEAITVLEFNRQLTVNKQEDIDGNIAFNMGLRTFAILVRKHKEYLPEDRRKLLEFINERVALFEELTMDTVLDVNSFFLATLQNLAKTLNINTSLTRQKSLTFQKKHAKPKSEVLSSSKRLAGTSQ